MANTNQEFSPNSWQTISTNDDIVTVMATSQGTPQVVGANGSSPQSPAISQNGPGAGRPQVGGGDPPTVPLTSQQSGGTQSGDPTPTPSAGAASATCPQQDTTLSDYKGTLNYDSLVTFPPANYNSGSNTADITINTVTVPSGSNQASSDIYIAFSNTGQACWDYRTVLGYAGGSQPASGSQPQNVGQVGAGSICNAPVGDSATPDASLGIHGPSGNSDWLSCDPGVPAWIGYTNSITSGNQAIFEFQIQAPKTNNSTLYFCMAEYLNGKYQWIDGPTGQPVCDHIRATAGTN